MSSSYPENNQRTIDSNVNVLQRSLKSRFAYVSKARANVWLTTGITLFVLGLIGAVNFVRIGNPNAGQNSDAAAPHGAFLTTGPSIEGPTEVQQGAANGFVFDAAGSEGLPIRYLVDWGDGTTPDNTSSSSTSKVTLVHTYSAAGSFIINAKAAFADTNGFSVAATRKVSVTTASGTGVTKGSLTASLDAASAPSQTIRAGQKNVSLLSVQFQASAQGDVTLKNLTFNAANGVGFQNLASIKVYSGGSVIPGASVDLGQAVKLADKVVISLGAGLTVPAGNTTVLEVRGDFRASAPGGTLSLGLVGVASQPDSLLPALPIYGNAMTIVQGK